MLDLLAAVVVVPLLVALGLTALYAVTVVPFLAVLALADRSGLAPGRWAAASLVAVVDALLDVPALGVVAVLAALLVGVVVAGLDQRARGNVETDAI